MTLKPLLARAAIILLSTILTFALGLLGVVLCPILGIQLTRESQIFVVVSFSAFGFVAGTVNAIRIKLPRSG